MSSSSVILRKGLSVVWHADTIVPKARTQHKRLENLIVLDVESSIIMKKKIRYYKDESRP